jgi:hypothetical protein
MYLKHQKYTACKATICLLALALLLGGCATHKYAQPHREKPRCLIPGSAAKHINISVNADGKPEFDNFVCPGGPHNNPGDICNGLNERPDIKFILTGPDARSWQFVDFQLSGNGLDWPGELPKGAYSDFEFGTDEALNEGRPFWSVTRNSMHVQNNNCHQFTVHYKLILENPETGERRIVDPIMDNTGSQLQ